MKNLTLLLVLLLCFASFAQTPGGTSTFYTSVEERPLLIINDDVIASVEVLKKIKTDNFAKLDISKDDVLSQTNLFPLDKKTKGIMRGNLNIDLDIKTQSELNSFFGLNPTNDIYVNGYLVEDKQQTVSTISIKMIDLRKADGIILKTPSLNITIE
ncbi:hypothetical protein [Zobellia barbeyronii]|uniref:Uncharacterized protein n=1 Tax=Zobellia barbeyronii TaxID=2748009 RepID=A0ABS5WKT3_9FLAO|nr:hypothetical protein [Zobellia barbeyronii]MBT2163603.1 hypothetical protein [Zobellia barbeyronii]